MQEKEISKEQLDFYRSECERLRAENRILSSKVTAAEARQKEVQGNLDRIKGSFAWKLAKPLRVLRVLFIRIGYYRSPKRIVKKLRAKKMEKRAKKAFGTNSFPDEARRNQEMQEKFQKEIKFSVLVPLYNTPENFLREMITSVTAQTYQNWQLCLADGSDAEHTFVGDICKEYAANDERICYRKLESNEGIAGNTNRCYEMATGNYIGLFDHDDILHPSVLYAYAKVIDEQDADYVYCDEVTFTKGNINHMVTLHFKPDYALDTLRANNYICHFSVFSRELLKETKLFRSEFDGSQDHDMILRLTSLAQNVVHVPRVLYYWRSHPGSVASDIGAKIYAIDAAKRAVEDHLEQYGIYNTVISSTRAFETIFRLEYELTAEPLITIIVPNRNHYADLSRCIKSVIDLSTYRNFELLVVDNQSDDAEVLKYYEEIEKNPQVKVLHYDKPFDYAAINNYAASEAMGEFLLLLNNDTMVITPKWIEELLMYAQRADVGAVGAKLLFKNDTIQHAGIVLGLGAHHTAGHIHYAFGNQHIGYMGRLCYAQNVSAVTAACMMVRKSYYMQVGGMSEEFAISLNDVDFCLKLRRLGYLNVFTPFAELYHYESCSRGKDECGENAERYANECAHFREIWQKELAAGDPYYNPNFALDRSDYSLNV